MILGNSIFCLPKGEYTHLRQEIVLGSVQMDAPNTHGENLRSHVGGAHGTLRP